MTHSRLLTAEFDALVEVSSVVVAALGPLVADAWTLIGSFLIVSLLFVRLVTTRSDGHTLAAVLERTGVGPITGTVLGLVPGCGGAIAVVSLYAEDAVGYGTLAAALVATAGDSAFLLLAVAPRVAALTYALSGLTAVVVGVAIRHSGLGVQRLDQTVRRLDGTLGLGGTVERDSPVRPDGAVGRDSPVRPDSIVPLHDESHSPPRGWSLVLAGWWIVAVFGFSIGVSRMVGGGVPSALPSVGSVSFVTLVSAGGVGLSLSVAVVTTVADWDWEHGNHHWVVGALTDTTVTASSLVVWIVVALGGVQLLAACLPVSTASVTNTVGPLAPVVGGLLGVVPGCGVHVGFVATYTEGAVPFSALVANAISQDGDAIFPLVAVDRVAAAVVTVHTALVAVLSGLLLELLATLSVAVPVAAPVALTVSL